MGLMFHPLVSAIRETDPRVNLSALRDRPELARQITEVADAAREVFGARHSLFLAGSLALAMRTGDFEEFREKGDRSDIDLWVVISGSMTDPGNDALCRALGESAARLDEFDIAAAKDPREESVFSIKTMREEIVHDVLKFSAVAANTYRSSSLRSVKPFDTFYGLNRSYRIETKEEPLTSGGFLWRWSAVPTVEGDFILTDIHSCFLFGGFLYDGLALAQARAGFLEEMMKRTGGSRLSRVSRDVFIGYFLSRFPHAIRKLYPDANEEKGPTR